VKNLIAILTGLFFVFLASCTNTTPLTSPAPTNSSIPSPIGQPAETSLPPVTDIPPSPPPTTVELDTATTRLTDGGVYRVSFTSALDPIAINQIHSWTLYVETTAGQLVDNAVISVNGGMPEHGHGLPTQPQVTQNLGNGDYLVEGLKFQMPGWWEVQFDISADGQSDSITFNLILQ
jgi:hypothetical protein